MGDATLQTELGRVLVTGGSGFVGANLVTELLNRGMEVRSLDRAPSPPPAHPRLKVFEGDISDLDNVAAAVDEIDTVFHTAAIIDLMGGASVTEEYRQRSFAVNVSGTKSLIRAAQTTGVKRFVYTASNSVVIGRSAHCRWRRSTALHRAIQRPLHRDQGHRRKVRVRRERCHRACSPARFDPAASGAAATRQCSARSSKA